MKGKSKPTDEENTIPELAEHQVALERIKLEREKLYLEQDKSERPWTSFNLMVRKSPWIFVPLFTYLSVTELAGKVTSVAVLGWFTGLEFEIKVSVGLAITISGYAACHIAWLRRRLKQTALEKKECQSALDPGRTSSDLLSNGNTNPKDEE